MQVSLLFCQQQKLLTTSYLSHYSGKIIDKNQVEAGKVYASFRSLEHHLSQRPVVARAWTAVVLCQFRKQTEDFWCLPASSFIPASEPMKWKWYHCNPEWFFTHQLNPFRNALSDTLQILSFGDSKSHELSLETGHSIRDIYISKTWFSK